MKENIVKVSLALFVVFCLVLSAGQCYAVESQSVPNMSIIAEFFETWEFGQIDPISESADQAVAGPSTVWCPFEKNTDTENEQNGLITGNDIMKFNEIEGEVKTKTIVCTGGYREDQNRSVGKSK
ncbi:MAG: hypothetical protein ABH869_01495 [Candidatus Omnitrophota bacterium]